MRFVGRNVVSFLLKLMLKEVKSSFDCKGHTTHLGSLRPQLNVLVATLYLYARAVS